MKSTHWKKWAIAIGLMSASALTFAANACCGDLACCLGHMLACCF